MAIELITGRAGEAHVDSADVRAYQAYTAGPGTYRLHGADASIETANSVLIAPGEILAEGCHIRVTGEGERVTIDNGNSNYSRIDLVCLHYTATGAGDSLREAMVFEVVKGTPATSEPEEPDLPGSGSVLDGSNDVYIPYARVTLTGLTPVVNMLVDQYSLPVSQGGTGSTTVDDALTALGLKTLKDNSPYVRAQVNGMRVFSGSTIVNFRGSMEEGVLNDTAIKGMLGRSFDQTRDVALFMNGDRNASGDLILGSVFRTSDKMLIAMTKQAGIGTGYLSSGPIRVNWIILAR